MLDNCNSDGPLFKEVTLEDVMKPIEQDTSPGMRQDTC